MRLSAISANNRRSQRRHYGVFPVVIRVTSAQGQRLKTTSLADNLSEGGLFMQLPQMLSRGTLLFTLVRLSAEVALAGLGEVVRIETGQNELYGVAVCFRHTRLLPLAN